MEKKADGATPLGTLKFSSEGVSVTKVAVVGEDWPIGVISLSSSQPIVHSFYAALHGLFCWQPPNLLFFRTGTSRPCLDEETPPGVSPGEVRVMLDGEVVDPSSYQGWVVHHSSLLSILWTWRERGFAKKPPPCGFFSCHRTDFPTKGIIGVDVSYGRAGPVSATTSASVHAALFDHSYVGTRRDEDGPYVDLHSFAGLARGLKQLRYVSVLRPLLSDRVLTIVSRYSSKAGRSLASTTGDRVGRYTFSGLVRLRPQPIKAYLPTETFYVSRQPSQEGLTCIKFPEGLTEEVVERVKTCHASLIIANSKSFLARVSLHLEKFFPASTAAHIFSGALSAPATVQLPAPSEGLPTSDWPNFLVVSTALIACSSVNVVDPDGSPLPAVVLREFIKSIPVSDYHPGMISSVKLPSESDWSKEVGSLAARLKNLDFKSGLEVVERVPLDIRQRLVIDAIHSDHHTGAFPDTGIRVAVSGDFQKLSPLEVAKSLKLQWNSVSALFVHTLVMYRRRPANALPVITLPELGRILDKHSISCEADVYVRYREGGETLKASTWLELSKRSVNRWAAISFRRVRAFDAKEVDFGGQLCAFCDEELYIRSSPEARRRLYPVVLSESLGA